MEGHIDISLTQNPQKFFVALKSPAWSHKMLFGWISFIITVLFSFFALYIPFCDDVSAGMQLFGLYVELPLNVAL